MGVVCSVEVIFLMLRFLYFSGLGNVILGEFGIFLNFFKLLDVELRLVKFLYGKRFCEWWREGRGWR